MAGSSVLDYLDSAWPSILGIGGNQSQPSLPGPIAGSSGGYSPSGAVDGSAVAPSNGPDTSFFNAWGTLPPQTGGGPSLTTPANAAPAANMPSPDMASASPIAYPNITGQTPAPAPNSPPMSVAPPNPGGGMPLSIAPPNPGAGAPGGGSLAQLLGVRPAPSPTQNAIQTGMAALGKGLSTVQGNTGAGAFARGMGGALTGGTQFSEAQKSQLFNQSSVAFRDMLAARNQDDIEGYRRAQAAYLNSRATAIQLGGGTGSGAWQNNPFGRTIQIENEAQKYEKGQQIILQKQWGVNGTSPDQQQTDLDGLQKKVDAYRSRLYKSAGIDQADGQKMLQWGTSKDTPFPTKGMSIDQFNEQVPMGAWYTDQNGAVRQRTVAPTGGAGSQSAPAQTSAAQSPGQQMQDYYDTSLAMQPSQ